MRCSTSARASAPIISSPASSSTSPGVTQGKGFAGAHEALGLRRSSRDPRRLGLAPLARFDRQPPGSGPGLQEQEDGRPHGRRATAPSRTSRSSAPTPSAACSSSRARCPATRAAGCWSRTRSSSPRPDDAPYPAGSSRRRQRRAVRGLVDEARSTRSGAAERRGSRAIAAEQKPALRRHQRDHDAPRRADAESKEG